MMTRIMGISMIRNPNPNFNPLLHLVGEQVPQSQRQQIADIFAFGRFEDFQNWTRTVLPLIFELGRLAPTLAHDGPNPEYPWPSSAPQFVPATFDFEVWRQLTDTGRGRQLIQVIKAAADNFPTYG